MKWLAAKLTKLQPFQVGKTENFKVFQLEMVVTWSILKHSFQTLCALKYSVNYFHIFSLIFVSSWLFQKNDELLQKKIKDSKINGKKTILLLRSGIIEFVYCVILLLL